MSGTEVAGSIVIGILTFILLHMLRPYVTKRSEEEGKIDALAASIEIVKENTAQLTAVTKKIEADISDRVWDRQARWNFRRDTYVRVLELVGEMIASFATTTFLAKSGRPIDNDEILRRNEQLMTELARLIGVCRVALSAEVSEALREYLRENAESDFEKKTELVRQLRDKLVEAAKRDLSYERFQDENQQ